jgi:hypothetical protein
LQANNLTFKALLAVDNTPHHPTPLNGLCEKVEVVFLPPNTTGSGHNFNFQSQVFTKNFCAGSASYGGGKMQFH